MKKVVLITLVIMIGFADAADGDHVDRHIWIETADGMFVADNETSRTGSSGHYYYNDNICGVMAEPQETRINGSIIIFTEITSIPTN